MDARTGLRLLAIVLFGIAAMPAHGAAQTPPPNLGQMSIEDLMSVEITSASRREQRTIDVAAAVFVITHEDIARSGVTTIPDLLRLVPGVQVAAINANNWAVSVRGFNDLRANKLLVLIDGRSVYNRLFSGVIWDALDLMLGDVERVEVIRGPGAALWGANAVNGVINIVTKSAGDTRGLVASVEAGTQSENAAVRFGGSAGATDYRVFAQWTGRRESLIAPGVGANDPSQQLTAGFRADRVAGPQALMFEGAISAGRLRSLWPDLNSPVPAAIADVESFTSSGHALARWTREGAGGRSVQLQSFVDLASRQEPVGDYSRKVLDLDTQFRMPLGGRQDLTAGAGYRFAIESLRQKSAISLVPVESRLSLSSAFVQDEVSLFGKRLAVTLGTQVQYDSGAGAGFQPSARVMWKVRPNQRLWASTSRALRTPSLQDRGIRAVLQAAPTPDGLPLVFVASGNPLAETERFVDLEAGYRIEMGTVASVDMTAFAGRYNHLQTTEPGAPVVAFVPFPHVVVTSVFGNQLEATTRGVEISGHWIPVRAWRFDGSFTSFHLTPRLAAASTDEASATADGNAPAAQWQLSAAYSPGLRTTLHAVVGRVGRLEQLRVSAYTRVDVTAEFRLTPGLTVMAIGQNLADAAHPEFGGLTSLVLNTEARRSIGVRIRWAVR